MKHGDYGQDWLYSGLLPKAGNDAHLAPDGAQGLHELRVDYDHAHHDAPHDACLGHQQLTSVPNFTFHPAELLAA